MNMFVVYDKLAEESGPIFEAKNVAVAQRQYRQLMATRGTSGPGEWSLLHLGSIDHQSQVVRLLEVPEDVTPVGGGA